MSGKSDRPRKIFLMTDEGQTLRGQAEVTSCNAAIRSPKDLDVVSAEETWRMLEALRVHQIELEIQNDELYRMQAELAAARTKYFDFYDLAPVGYWIFSEQGLILEANLTAATLLGVTRSALIKKPIFQYILEDDQDVYYLHRKQLFETGNQQACELRMKKSDGTHFRAHMEATVARDADGNSACRVVMSDVTERRFQEDEHELMARLSGQVNTPAEFRQFMSDLSAFLQNWSGCEAIGIRLRSGDNFPYFESRGFPPEFVRDEDHICAYGQDGRVLRDGSGAPVLEGVSGDVLCGRFDSAKPFFTARGSFWTNSATVMIGGLADFDKSVPDCHRCMEKGYESVALIPLRSGRQVFGLLQFSDHRTHRFTPAKIARFERMAISLAVALSRRQAEEVLRASEECFSKVFVANPIAKAIMRIDDGLVFDVNRTWSLILGYSRREIIGKTLRQIGLWTDLDHQTAFIKQAKQDGSVYDFETTFFAKNLERRSVVLGGEIIYRDGEPRLLITCNDVTERKLAAETLRAREERFRDLYNLAPVAFMSVNANDGSLRRFNDMLPRLLGYDLEILRGMKVFALFADTPDGLPKAKRMLKRLATGDQVHDARLQMKREDGVTIWVSFSANPVYDEDGNVTQSRAAIIAVA